MCPKSVIIVFVLIFAKMGDNQVIEPRCRKLLLIQRVDPSLTGLEYVVLGGGHYYFITSKHLSDSNVPIEPKFLPDDRFDDPKSVMVYINDKCLPPLSEHYFLSVNQAIADESQKSFNNWIISMDLLNQTYSWSTPKIGRSYFLEHDILFPKIYEDIDFTISWPQKKSLYVVKNGDYHTILSTDNCKIHEYIKGEMSFNDILKPYESYDSCFIPDDKQLMCFGQNLSTGGVRLKFRTFQIDLDESESGRLRVDPKTGRIPTPEEEEKFPIMGRIVSIAKQSTCNRRAPKSTPKPEPKPVDPTKPNEPTKPEETAEPKEEGSLFWLILVILLIAVMAFVVILCFCCLKPKEPEVEPKPNVDQNLGESPSDVRMRSDIKLASKSPPKSVAKSSIEAQPSVRSSIRSPRKKIILQ